PLTSDVINSLSQLENGIAGLLGQTTGTGDLSPTTTDLLNTANDSLNEVLGGSPDAADPNFDLTSNIDGNVGMLKIATDASEVFLNVDGSIHTVMIGGSLTGNLFENGGNLFVTGDIHSLKIGKDIIGGGEVNTGDVSIQGDVGAVTIGGSVMGGEGSHSGAL